MIFIQLFNDNFDDNLVFLLFLLVKNNGERKSKSDNNNIM